MFKRVVVLIAVTAGLALSSSSADAGIFFRRVAPVRRVAARAVLPPYPVARRVAYRRAYYPVVRPVVRRAYRAPVVFGPGVSVVVGY